jgi:plastocyanin
MDQWGRWPAPGRIWAIVAVVGAIVVAIHAAGCGSGSSNNTSPSPAASADATITITSSGANPRNVTIPPGGRVAFANQDSIVHEMYSDPHPEHTDCPEFDQVGYLSPGETRLTGNLNTTRVCGFHDHIYFQNKSLQGSVTIH